MKHVKKVKRLKRISKEKDPNKVKLGNSEKNTTGQDLVVEKHRKNFFQTNFLISIILIGYKFQFRRY